MIDKSGLQNFIKKMNNLKKNASNLDNIVANGVAEKIADYTQQAYPNANVYHEKESDNIEKVVAEHDKIAFWEFGTGVAGEDKYLGTLPTETISFTDRKGNPDTTEGWEYNYYAKHQRARNPDTQVNDWQGYAPKAGMWNAEMQTVKDIENNNLISEIITKETK